MRLPSWTTSSVFAIALFSVLQVSNAQSASAVGSASVSPIGGCTGLPNSAKETQTEIKTNADGTTTEHSSVQLVWRDADGRTRRQTMWKTRNGEEAPEHSVIVYEPLKRVWWRWISPDLGIVMRHIIDDPRTPKVIVELSDVKRDVPDPALFQVPVRIRSSRRTNSPHRCRPTDERSEARSSASACQSESKIDSKHLNRLIAETYRLIAKSDRCLTGLAGTGACE